MTDHKQRRLDATKTILNIHAIMPRSAANGPGVRTAIWFQGCTLTCPQCFNPATHSTRPVLTIRAGELVRRIARSQDVIEGVTITGGEPFQQLEGLFGLLSGIRRSTELSIILSSGYTLAEIGALPRGLDILKHADVLIAGRYLHSLRTAQGLRGSSNKTAHFLTDRYAPKDLAKTPLAEIRISPAGEVCATGVAPVSHMNRNTMAIRTDIPSRPSSREQG